LRVVTDLGEPEFLYPALRIYWMGNYLFPLRHA